MRVERIGSHAYRIIDFPVAERIVLGHYILSYHTASLTDVQLMWPIAIICKLILCQSPLCHFIPNFFRYFRIVRQEIHQPLLVIGMFLDDLLTAFVTGFGIIVIHADKIRTEWSVVVRVRFPVRNWVELLEGFPPAGSKNTGKQFVVFGVIV